jgi:hypothetical protein
MLSVCPESIVHAKSMIVSVHAESMILSAHAESIILLVPLWVCAESISADLGYYSQPALRDTLCML